MRTLGRLVTAVAPLATVVALLPAAPVHADEPEPALHLVTLRAGSSLSEGHRALGAVDAPEVVYRWSRALKGFAVPLTQDQATDLRADRSVEFVEQDRRHRLAGAPEADTRAGSPYARGQVGKGGRGSVIGVVDTGLWPDSPLFADSRALGRAADFSGSCEPGEAWPTTACNGKIAGARWFVDGFGEENLRTQSSVSPRDDSGHGTQVASLAAGNSGVSVDLTGRPAGVYSGVAPQARLAIYKACWSAPDPVDDGCSSADLVTAIDRAVSDGVDVLNLSVAGSPRFDTVDRALLGAAEAGVTVIAAAGNTGQRAFAGYASPWVTTVGGLVGVKHRGALQLTDGTRLDGAMLSPAGTDRVRVIRAVDAASVGASRSAARECRPGSLDAGIVAGTLVVCERGGLGRIDKSAAVARADGVGMVLVNQREGRTDVVADLHTIPTVHLDRADSVRLRRRLAADDRVRARILPAGSTTTAPSLQPASPAGDPGNGVLKPDLVAPAGGLLGAVPPEVHESRWNVLSGTSAAAAQVSGLAARLHSEHPQWSAAAVRSTLATATTPVPGRVLRTGAGRASTRAPGLVLEVGPRAYRRYLSGDLLSSRLNTPSVVVRPGHAPVYRTVTNRSGARRTWQASVVGFARHRVTVSPSSIALAPGQSTRFRVSTSGPSDFAYDGGVIVLRAPDLVDVRIPVVMGR